jgi:predicted HTH domain antitoxin
MDNVCIEIPREVLNSARMSVAELKKELALILYQQNKLSFGKARELTELNVWAFQQLLGDRGIPVHYDVDDLNDDIKNLEFLRQNGL